MQENCCPTSHNSTAIVNVAGSLFNNTTGSPFAGYPVGTRFHFSGSSPIILSGLAFQPPVGSVILMDSGKDLYLQDGASLSLAGVSITAACNEMWGRLWVRNTAAGISSTLADGTGESAGANPPANAPNLRNQVSHSLGGIEFEQTSAGSPVPYYRFASVDFLHNEVSMKLWRVGTTANVPLDFVTRSVFDSTPASFKSPNDQATTYVHYSRYHVLFAGLGGYQWIDDTFRNALFGFHNPTSSDATTLLISGVTFTNIWLAGINVNSTNAAGQINFYGAVTYASGFTIPQSTITFPTALALPTTPQFTDALANDVLDHQPESRGIFSNTPLFSSFTTFTQNNDPYSSFAFSERYKQIGIKTPRLATTVRDNFNLLHTGIELSDVLLPSSARPNGTDIHQNVFTACRRGIEGHGGGLANRGDLNPPRRPTASLPLMCNTFDRVNATRSGTMYGVYLANDAYITFDPLPIVNPAPPLTNRFLDYNTSIPNFYAIYNNSPVNTLDVEYTTFDNYVTANAPPMLLGQSNLDALIQSVTPHGNTSYASGQACGTNNPGLERSAPPKSTLDPCSPNPASGYTTLRYQLARETHTAALQVRRGTDGQLMQQSNLRAGSTANQLSLQG